MLRDLSSLVHRQLQITISRNKSRNFSENSAPMGYHMYAKGSPLGTIGGLEALRLVPPEVPEADNNTVERVSTARPEDPSHMTTLEKQCTCTPPTADYDIKDQE
ncbi:Voltage-gated Ion Channel (VIC) Superfamily [Phytophthora cinnamomi]|uniref:Voltage-gated Ion Channel (VIC) Superfamily n=1 Tax=Phytophthora cinnamomi TaxID=4785 RepID=UPI00355AB945|nr:Voltage-gated Ion Channel (VIC) Superfamily [Phytophthora cinnamomi]